jgi:hypothetical protein
VHIGCATFEEKIDLSDVTVNARLRLEQSRFNEAVDISGLRSTNSLSFMGSVFRKGLSAYDIELQGGLFLGDTTISGEQVALDLIGGKVGRSIDMHGANLTGRFAGGRLDVGSNLLFDEGTMRIPPDDNSGDVFSLTGATIGGDVSMEGTTIEGAVRADRLSVGGSVFMRERASFQTVDLIAAQIGQHLALLGGTFDGQLDLTGARINGELRLSGPGGERPTWNAGAQLVLRNAHATALNATEVSWDGLGNEDLDLIGFTYDQLGGLEAQAGDTLADLPPEWLVNEWLGKQQGIDRSYTPQPFQELARVLRTTGHMESADAVMVAARDQQLNTTRSWLPWLRLQILRLLISYGYDSWRAGIWFSLLVMLGVLRLRLAPEGRAMRFGQKFWFSLDLATPVLDLNKAHDNVTLSGSTQIYFYLHQIAGFVLVGFLLAGLSGLTR